MAIYVYCSRPSEGARVLTKELGAVRLRRFDGMNFWNKRKRIPIEKGDVVICWGNSFPKLEGVKVLNGVRLGDKFKQAYQLSEFGVRTISVTNEQPLYDREQYVGRSAHHAGGNDLLNGVERPDYWVYKMNFVEEYRVHSFLGKCIRAGKKVLREGFEPWPVEVPQSEWKPGITRAQLREGGFLLSGAENPDVDNKPLAHPWVRNFDGGWKISYDGFKSKEAFREVAHQAVKALGLDFGAVDIAKGSDGYYYALEVNRAPGIEGNSLSTYVRKIQGWINDDNSGSTTTNSEADA